MVVVNGIKETQITRYIRFLPITWYGHVCMRVEVYGCEAYTGKTRHREKITVTLNRYVPVS